MWSKVSMFQLLLTLSAIVTLSQSQDVRVNNFEISDANPNSCDVIIENSRFDGDCCSLNATDGDGCVLNIVNGRCKITGQYWTIDWTSTYNASGAKCPPSEYPEYAPAAFADDGEEEPVSDTETVDGASSFGIAVLSALAAGLIVIAL